MNISFRNMIFPSYMFFTSEINIYFVYPRGSIRKSQHQHQHKGYPSTYNKHSQADFSDSLLMFTERKKQLRIFFSVSNIRIIESHHLAWSISFTSDVRSSHQITSNCVDTLTQSSLLSPSHPLSFTVTNITKILSNGKVFY